MLLVGSSASGFIMIDRVRHRLYYHAIWTTRGRLPLLDAELAAFLGRYLRSIARQERAHVLEMGIVTTHLHLLVRTDPQTNLSRLVQRFKGGSAHQANVERLGRGVDGLRWAKGYTLETVSSRGLEAVRQYLRTQHERHPKEAIPGWAGDAPEYEQTGAEQWASPNRARL
jgi:REP-associated tyrosine transposase